MQKTTKCPADQVGKVTCMTQNALCSIRNAARAKQRTMRAAGMMTIIACGVWGLGGCASSGREGVNLPGSAPVNANDIEQQIQVIQKNPSMTVPEKERRIQFLRDSVVKANGK